MGAVVSYATVVGLLAVAAIVVGVAAIVVMVGGRAPSLLLAGILLIVGTIPATVLTVLWYARLLDSRWAMNGPGPFGFVGSGPGMLAATLLTLIVTSGCWVAAVWMAAAALRLERRGR